MTILRDPFYGAEVDVPDSLVQRYRDAGYLGADGEGGEPGKPKGNASREEWAAYADTLGVEYAEDAKRDDIKAAVEAAGE